MSENFDVVVIGGGAAGLNGALMLGRSRRSVLVIDAGAPRNAPAAGVHGLLGREGMPPGELMARGRAEVEMYGGEIRTGTVTTVAPLPTNAADTGTPATPGAPAAAGIAETQRSTAAAGFVVTLGDGSVVRARRILVASGLVDELPDVPGLRELWGKDVLHCPYCHGWEARDRAIGVLASGPMSVHQTLLFRQLSDDITYFSHRSPELTAEQAGQFGALGVKVVDGEVAGLDAADGTLRGVRLADGTVVARDVLAVATRLVARLDFLAELGLKPVQHPMGVGDHLPADPTGRTEVAGVWVAGNATDLTAQVGNAAAAGAMAGAQINADLVAEDTQRAVERYSSPSKSPSVSR